MKAAACLSWFPLPPSPSGVAPMSSDGCQHTQWAAFQERNTDLSRGLNLSRGSKLAGPLPPAYLPSKVVCHTNILPRGATRGLYSGTQWMARGCGRSCVVPRWGVLPGSCRRMRLTWLASSAGWQGSEVHSSGISRTCAQSLDKEVVWLRGLICGSWVGRRIHG